MALREVVELMMIYDAPSGKLAAFSDSLKKVFGRGCSLCATTHGLLDKRQEWREFEQSLDVPMTYLHSDEIEAIERSTNSRVALPCVLARLADGEVVTLLGPDVIARCTGTPADLQERILFYAEMNQLALGSLGDSAAEAAETADAV